METLSPELVQGGVPQFSSQFSSPTFSCTCPDLSLVLLSIPEHTSQNILSMYCPVCFEKKDQVGEQATLAKVPPKGPNSPRFLFLSLWLLSCPAASSTQWLIPSYSS